MDDEELAMFQKVGILVAALERIAESVSLDLECCKQVAADALAEFNKSE